MNTMRTTVTFDSDVAVRLKRLRKERDLGLKEIINEAVRQGLDKMEMPPKPRKPFVTRAVNLGEPLMNLDNIGEVLELLDEEDYIRKKLYPRDPG
jgi:adenine C2-methylase RlmN of 23S rRNA A2503 and tRNA A37